MKRQRQLMGSALTALGKIRDCWIGHVPGYKWHLVGAIPATLVERRGASMSKVRYKMADYEYEQAAMREEKRAMKGRICRRCRRHALMGVRESVCDRCRRTADERTVCAGMGCGGADSGDDVGVRALA